jgi:hypothetical protein
MTPERAVIECFAKFWKCNQLYVAFSRFKTPASLGILIPADMEDCTFRAPVDMDVVPIIEAMDFSRASPIVPRLPVDQVELDLSSLDSSDEASSTKLSSLDDYVDAPDDQVHIGKLFPFIKICRDSKLTIVSLMAESDISFRLYHNGY